jgi:hypothetical protein
MATVWSVLPPSTTINSSPGARVTPLRVAGRWSCSLRVGTITEMRGEGDGVTTELSSWTKIFIYIIIFVLIDT